MMNRAVLVGRLTRDPDLRYTPNGVAVANFTLAVNRPFTNQQGERDADFINCVVWRRQAENLANYMKKGSMVGVDGRIQTRTYEDQDGKTVYVTEVVADNVHFLESRGSSRRQEESSGMGTQGFQQGTQPTHDQGQQDDSPFSQDGEPIDISDDDLPF
ncbi:MAG TPA: single-stranded DNA-binding protein [Bacillota bacterium]|nr:single-stranded DNA-binding protein [Bacillota bacterium]